MVGIVLVVAGVAKVRDGEWTDAARRFGAPAPVAAVLPWTEIVLGALLVADVGRPWTAVVAGLLLAAFTAIVAVRVVRGDVVPCACFGSPRSAAPVSWWTIARNTLLVALAVVAASGAK